MESNLTLANMMSGGTTYGGPDLQGSMRVNPNPHSHNLQQHHHSQQPVQRLMNHQPMHDMFPLTMGQSHKCVHPKSTVDYNKGERGKNSPADDEEVSDYEEGVDGHTDPSKGKKNCPQWQRVRWTSSMVRILITGVSYLTEDALFQGCPRGRRKYLNLQKKGKGKWKLISKVMSERGFFVSPQQCEDKFNDLNKRYKKLNEILGKGTSCQVVENPALLDMMGHLPEQAKDEVRKILSSKHLFYEELCSYHNNNRLHLPHDASLQQSLQLALGSREDNDPEQQRYLHDDVEDDHDAESDDHEDYGENSSKLAYALSGDPSKRMKQGLGLDNFNFRSQFPQDFMNGGFQLQSQTPCADLHSANPESQKAASMQKQWLKSQSVQLEERKLQIEMETLELEKERFKWQRFCKRKDRELEKLKTENERMKLENERIALELKRMEMSMNSKT